jgi:hypothetical protein
LGSETPLEDERATAVESQDRSLLRGVGIAFAGGLLTAWAIAGVLSYGTGSVMTFTSRTLILYPVFPMFLLVALVLTQMGWLRVSAVKTRKVSIQFYRTYSEGAEPASMQVVTRHFINLFEVPVLFYVVVILIYITEQVTCLMVGLAWAYVILRGAHSYIHLTSNDVPNRLSAYLASGLVLAVMWGMLFVRLLSAEATT